MKERQTHLSLVRVSVEEPRALVVFELDGE